MTAEERKKKNEAYLKELGFKFVGLPILEEEDNTEIREPVEVAKRIFVLAYLGVYAEDGDRDEIIEYLKAENIWDAVSEIEKELFLKDKLTKQDKINISWRSEAMFTLLWAIHKIDKLDLPIEECSIWDTLNLLPDYLEPTKDFISYATTRTKSEILNETDLIYRIHLIIHRDIQTGNEPTANIDESMVKERRYAFNWLTFYEDNWDDITLDT